MMKKFTLILMTLLVVSLAATGVSAEQCNYYTSCWDKPGTNEVCFRTVAVCDTGVSNYTSCDSYDITPGAPAPNDGSSWTPPIGHVDHGKSQTTPLFDESFWTPTIGHVDHGKGANLGEGNPWIGDFKLEIDGVIVAGFKAVDGLDAKTEVIEYQSGDDTIIKQPDRVKYFNLVFKQGFITDSALRKWIEETVEGKADRKSGSVILEGSDEVKIYDFIDALPVQWKWKTHSKDGKAQDGEGLRFIEELNLSVGGIELIEIEIGGDILELRGNIPAGDNQFKVIDAGFNVQLPADFFWPGSEPFEDTIICGGGDDGSVDTIIKRLDDIILPPPPSEDTIPIEIIELNLVSCQPITVTNNNTKELWNVQVSLPPDLAPIAPFPLGEMTIEREHENGGTFDSILPVQLRFTFTKVGDSQETRVIDDPATPVPIGVVIIEDIVIDAFKAFEVPWQTCPSADPEFGFNFCPGSIQFFLDDGSWLNLEPVVPSEDDSTVCPAGVASPEKEFTSGDLARADVNSDGVIDEKDTEAFAEALKSLVDINRDGAIDEGDIQLLQDLCPDVDNDAVIDGLDNCPFIANPNQSDLDADGFGDACDACPNDPDNDADGDGMCGDVDSCPLENPQGLDADSDGCTDTIEGLYEQLQNTEMQAGVKNSLLAKVNSALSSFTSGEVHTAINQLGAFINQVEAQSGKKISREEATVLTGFAQNIIQCE